MKFNNNIPHWCADGVQEAMYEELTKLVAPPADVLEFGAGLGRLSARLQNAGYNITAADWNTEMFLPSNITCHKIDCDDSSQIHSSWQERSFDAIICGDLIEHLKYPWQFIENCHHLLKPGGHLLISTPYITSASSRINMLVQGNVNSFGPKSSTIGHISPIFPDHLYNMFMNTGFNHIQKKGIGTKSYLREKSLKGIIQLGLTFALRMFMRKTSNHPVLLTTGRKIDIPQYNQLPLGVGTSDVYTSPIYQ